MIDGVRLKFCGLTSLVDANFADALGADYLGFILYPKSPRYLALRDFENLKPNLPTGRKMVAVMVTPTAEELAEVAAAGFDRFQIHFPAELPLEEMKMWSAAVGKERLWLAPKRKPGTIFETQWLEFADTILVDTFSADQYGGTGKPGDWSEFAQLKTQFPKTTWVLSGGLKPENVDAALTQSGARFIDLSSSVEIAPGIKDHAKMKAMILSIHKHRTPSPNAHD